MSDENTRYIAVHQFIYKDELNDKKDAPQTIAPGSIIPPGFFTSGGKHDEAYAQDLLKRGAIKHYDQFKKEADAIAHAQAALEAEGVVDANSQDTGSSLADPGADGQSGTEGDPGANGKPADDGFGEGAADGSNVNEAKDGKAENAENAGNAGKSVASTAKSSAAKSAGKKK